MHLPTAAGLALASLASTAALADFTTPAEWDRGTTPLSVYGEWEVFTSPAGPNLPDVGSFIGGTPAEDAPALDAYDDNEASGSFITSSGNIYSFAGLVSPQIDIPGFGLGTRYTTTILLQVRTQGSEADATTFYLNGDTEPTSITELDRGTPGGAGGALVDLLVRFDVPSDLDGYHVNFIASATSMSLDRVAVDTFTQPTTPSGCNASDIAAPLGELNIDDVLGFLNAFASGDASADLASPQGELNIDDVLAFLNAFAAGCPS